ncbi:hypothetical protein RHMOL_Rhmol05G0243700 [Rhododendron molle]|uniref:Uncharacterized protein n=1 Tax=Rhododendron molle TaxID=49168 RepID=A0ACC0NST1_RHOML|nr:hypothetical protein RHMOL_Rhmol05G0243700 [Rhododendron molle]
MTTKIVANLIESIIENDDEEAIKDVVRLVCLYLCVNEDELSPTSEEDLIYKIQIEVEEVGEEQEEEEEGEGEEEEEDEDEEEEEVIYIEEEEEEQNEIEQELIFIEEEDEEQEGHEKKEQVKEEEDDENNKEDMETKEMLEEGDSAEEGDSVAVEQVAEEGNAAVVEQVTEEVDAPAIEEDEGDSAEGGNSVQKLSEEGGVENGNDSEMDDIFHTAETVDEQIKSTNQSTSTFVAETQFSNQARDQTAVEDDVDFGERQTQTKNAIDELAERLKKVQDKLEQGVSNLQDKCANLEEDNVILEAQIRVLEVQNSELKKQTLLLRLELNEERQHRKKVEYEKTKMTREKDAEIALLKQRIIELTDEKINIKAEHVVHQVTQQWKEKRQKQSASTVLDSMTDAQLHEITQQGRASIEKRKQKEAASQFWKPSMDSVFERQIHELKHKFVLKKNVIEGNKEISKQVDSKQEDSNKRK